MCIECRRYKCDRRCPNYRDSSSVPCTKLRRNIVLNFYIKERYKGPKSKSIFDEIGDNNINEIRSKEGEKVD